MDQTVNFAYHMVGIHEMSECDMSLLFILFKIRDLSSIWNWIVLNLTNPRFSMPGYFTSDFLKIRHCVLNVIQIFQLKEG